LCRHHGDGIPDGVPPLESRAHIQIQESIEERFAHNPEIQVCSAEFLCWIHDQFYQRLPQVFREVTDPKTGNTDRVVPGDLRRRNVRVGRHVPPPYTTLEHFLRRFAEVYSPGKHRGQPLQVGLDSSVG